MKIDSRKDKRKKKKNDIVNQAVRPPDQGCDHCITWDVKRSSAGGIYLLRVPFWQDSEKKLVLSA